VIFYAEKSENKKRERDISYYFARPKQADNI